MRKIEVGNQFIVVITAKAEIEKDALKIVKDAVKLLKRTIKETNCMPAKIKIR